MITEKLKHTMRNDSRLQIPIFRELPFWLDQECQPLIDLVNNTGDISSLLFNPIGSIIQQRLRFNPALHNHDEIQFLVNAHRDFYPLSPFEKAALDLSDNEYLPAAYNMDACFLEWLLRDTLASL